MKHAGRFQKALSWIQNHSNLNGGISVSSKEKHSYPEVSGYFIPTLLAWNEIERAKTYGNWLKSIQHTNGAWPAPGTDQEYAFDSGQILKGMAALAKIDESFKPTLKRGCDWIASLIQDDGSMNAPDIKWWAGGVPSGVLLYALEPLIQASEILNEPSYKLKAQKCLDFFCKDPQLTDFNCLSHFHAYILEALVDLGRPELAKKGLEKVIAKQRSNGAIPAYQNVHWVCSTGMFQYAIVWYKLGDFKQADLTFEYVTKLQNRSGAWYGSYGFFKKYFPKAEISWCVKYFLDALSLKLRADFEKLSPIFSQHIEKSDGRYQLVLQTIPSQPKARVLDAGCGKGRYLRNLIQDQPNAEYHASDLSEQVMSSLPDSIQKKQGSLIKLPYPDASFDMVYTIEALEHAVHISSAIGELTRVLKPGGKLLIIDKNIKKLGRIKICDWEQWFGTKELSGLIASHGLKVSTQEGIPYEHSNGSDRLFTAWIGTK